MKINEGRKRQHTNSDDDMRGKSRSDYLMEDYAMGWDVTDKFGKGERQQNSEIDDIERKHYKALAREFSRKIAKPGKVRHIDPATVTYVGKQESDMAKRIRQANDGKTNADVQAYLARVPKPVSKK